jgi:uncharacterized protein YkwD
MPAIASFRHAGHRVLSLLGVLGLATALIGGCPTSPSTPSGGSDSTGGTPPTSSSPSGGDSSPTTTGGVTLDASHGCTTPAQVESLRRQVLDLVNFERTSRGLDPLSRSATLEAQANQYACEMIVYDFFAHENPVTGTTLVDRAEEFGYVFQMIGENLAAGQRTPQQAMSDWMDSPGHRANILEENFTEIGIGIRTGGSFGWYWVQEFGLPR